MYLYYILTKVWNYETGYCNDIVSVCINLHISHAYYSWDLQGITIVVLYAFKL